MAFATVNTGAKTNTAAYNGFDENRLTQSFSVPYLANHRCSILGESSAMPVVFQNVSAWVWDSTSNANVSVQFLIADDRQGLNEALSLPFTVPSSASKSTKSVSKTSLISANETFYYGFINKTSGYGNQYFGAGSGLLRTSAAGNYFDGWATANTFDNKALYGSVTYNTAPEQVTGLTILSLNPGEVLLDWNDPNNGGTAITGYRVQYREPEEMTWQTLNVATTYSTATLTGFTPGKIYQFRVAARNAVTDDLGVTYAGLYSSSVSIRVMRGVKVSDGAGNWTDGQIKVADGTGGWTFGNILISDGAGDWV
jgi:hypothetical protein